MNGEWSKEIMAINLRYYMEAFGKNQKEMAAIAGVSAPTFNDWLKEKKYPRIDKIERMAQYFGILKSDLIEDKQKQPTDESELSIRKREFIRKVEQMSEEQLERLEQILSLVESTKL